LASSAASNAAPAPAMPKPTFVFRNTTVGNTRLVSRLRREGG
jgi:hypothetical protein